MLFSERNRRIALGFLEHIGTISIARYRSRFAGIDWARIMREWDHGESGDENPLKRLSPDVPGLALTYYACHGTLPLHVDAVGRKILTFGVILHAQGSLRLNAADGSVEVDAGSLYMLDPRSQHGAIASGSFVFAAVDLPEHEAPTAEKFRRRVSRDIRKINERHARKETI